MGESSGTEKAKQTVGMDVPQTTEKMKQRVTGEERQEEASLSEKMRECYEKLNTSLQGSVPGFEQGRHGGHVGEGL